MKRLLLLGLFSVTLNTALVVLDGMVTTADALRLRATAVYDENGKVVGWYCLGACAGGSALCCDIGPGGVE